MHSVDTINWYGCPSYFDWLQNVWLKQDVLRLSIYSLHTVEPLIKDYPRMGQPPTKDTILDPFLMAEFIFNLDHLSNEDKMADSKRG